MNPKDIENLENLINLPKVTRLLVAGGRDFNDYAFLHRYLSRLQTIIPPIETLIHGAARGADSLAAQWATSRSIPTLSFPAQWDLYGKSAGYRRNLQMLLEGKPTLVVAFPGGRGTAHMVELARTHQIPTHTTW